MSDSNGDSKSQTSRVTYYTTFSLIFVIPLRLERRTYRLKVCALPAELRDRFE